MTHSEKENWLVNNAAAAVAEAYGSAVVKAVFEKYGAHSSSDLSPAHFTEVFDELDFIATDN